MWEFPSKVLARKNKSVNHRLQFKTDLLEFGWTKLGIAAKQGESEFNRAWAAALIGFMFLFRESELSALELGDITFGETAI